MKVMVDFLTWKYWHQQIESSACLTEKGRQVGHWAIDQFANFLGNDWLASLKGKDHLLLSQYWCPYNEVSIVFFHIFKLAALIVLLKNARNFNKFRKTMNRNHDYSNWIHSFVQMETAGLGLRHGWECMFEPELLDNHSADLLLSEKTGKTILFEVVSMGMDSEFIGTNRYFDELSNHLTMIGLKYDVSIEGNIESEFVSPDEKQAWLKKIETAAEKVSLSGDSVIIHGPYNNVVEISKNTVSPGLNSFTGPITKKDVLGRIEARVKDKARQAESADKVWINFDDHGGLWYFTIWATLPLSERLNILDIVLRDILSRHPNIAGIIISNGWGWRTLQEEKIVKKADAGNETSIAICRFLPAAIQKETFIIARNELVKDDLEQLATWYMNESTWLDWALNELGQPQFNELVCY